MSAPNIQAVKTWLLSLQANIVAAVEAVDGKEFIKDSWERPEGGGGISRLIEEGNVLERGGVGFSHVTGSSLPPSAAAATLRRAPHSTRLQTSRSRGCSRSRPSAA